MKNIRKLEAVQRRATKLIPSFYNLTYSERLQELNLPMQLTLPSNQNGSDYDLQNPEQF